MSDSPRPSSSTTLAALRQYRERTIAVLCEHFARDNLETEDLEGLIDRAHGATSVAELDSLLHGLPALDSPMAQAQPQTGTALVRPGDVGEQEFVVAVMGGAERQGAWTPARSLYVVALMGGAELDFRHAALAPGVTEVYVLAFMGGVSIVVPPGVQVQSNGIGIMGGFEHVGQGKFPVDRDVPILRISGAAMMGGVEVVQRLPGETGHDAKRRLREERRELRDEHRARHRLDRGDHGGGGR